MDKEYKEELTLAIENMLKDAYKDIGIDKDKISPMSLWSLKEVVGGDADIGELEIPEGDNVDYDKLKNDKVYLQSLYEDCTTWKDTKAGILHEIAGEVLKDKLPSFLFENDLGVLEVADAIHVIALANQGTVKHTDLQAYALFAYEGVFQLCVQQAEFKIKDEVERKTFLSRLSLLTDEVAIPVTNNALSSVKRCHVALFDMGTFLIDYLKLN